jgi:hypothetical protein
MADNLLGQGASDALSPLNNVAQTAAPSGGNSPSFEALRSAAFGPQTGQGDTRNYGVNGTLPTVLPPEMLHSLTSDMINPDAKWYAFMSGMSKPQPTFAGSMSDAYGALSNSMYKESELKAQYMPLMANAMAMQANRLLEAQKLMWTQGEAYNQRAISGLVPLLRTGQPITPAQVHQVLGNLISTNQLPPNLGQEYFRQVTSDNPADATKAIRGLLMQSLKPEGQENAVAPEGEYHNQGGEDIFAPKTARLGLTPPGMVPPALPRSPAPQAPGIHLTPAGPIVTSPDQGTAAPANSPQARSIAAQANSLRFPVMPGGAGPAPAGAPVPPVAAPGQPPAAGASPGAPPQAGGLVTPAMTGTPGAHLPAMTGTPGASDIPAFPMPSKFMTGPSGTPIDNPHYEASMADRTADRAQFMKDTTSNSAAVAQGQSLLMRMDRIQKYAAIAKTGDLAPLRYDLGATLRDLSGTFGLSPEQSKALGDKIANSGASADSNQDALSALGAMMKEQAGMALESLRSSAQGLSAMRPSQLEFMKFAESVSNPSMPPEQLQRLRQAAYQAQARETAELNERKRWLVSRSAGVDPDFSQFPMIWNEKLSQQFPNTTPITTPGVGQGSVGSPVGSISTPNAPHVPANNATVTSGKKIYRINLDTGRIESRPAP